MRDICHMKFDEFVAMSCEPQSRGILRRFIDFVLGVVSPRHRERVSRVRERERAWPRRVAEVRAICEAMTPDERKEPKLVDYAARQRIAAQAGVEAFTVSQLIRTYQSYRRAMTQLDQVQQNAFREQVL